MIAFSLANIKQRFVCCYFSALLSFFFLVSVHEAHMLVTDNGFTGSGVSVYGSVQMLLALGHFRPGPQLYYLHVCMCACVSMWVSLFTHVCFLSLSISIWVSRIWHLWYVNRWHVPQRKPFPLDSSCSSPRLFFLVSHSPWI